MTWWVGVGMTWEGAGMTWWVGVGMTSLVCAEWRGCTAGYERGTGILAGRGSRRVVCAYR